jgi:hypothetical protein
LDPLVETWPGGQAIVRCHDSRFGATELNPGRGQGRFHPFQDAHGLDVPTLYGASHFDGSLSESVFHNVPVRGRGRSIRRGALKPMLMSTIATRRSLTLIQLHGHGLSRLGVTRSELIESPPRFYARTAAWAAALHSRLREADGLIWVSRKFDTAFALVLFGDRVRRADLFVVEAPLPLYDGHGLARVRQSAERAGITVLAE